MRGSLWRTTSECLALPLELLLLHGTWEGVRDDTSVGTPSTGHRSMTDHRWSASRQSGAQHMPGDGQRNEKRYRGLNSPLTKSALDTSGLLIL